MGAIAFPFLPVATRALSRLQRALASKTKFEALLAQVGWRANLSPADLNTINTSLGLDQPLADIKELADNLRLERGPVLETAETLATAIKNVFQAVQTLSTSGSISSLSPFNQNGFWVAIAQDIPSLLLASELKASNPAVYGALVLTGVFQEETLIPTGAARLPYTRIYFPWK